MMEPFPPTGAAPPVSIALPVYNGSDHIRSALDALLAQDYGDFELVISDNGSLDETEAICREYAARDRRIRYFRAPQNRGMLWNFNYVYSLTRGEYIMWAGHHDLWGRRYIRACLDRLEEVPEAVLAYPILQIIDDRGADVGEPQAGIDTVGLPLAERLHQVLIRCPCQATYGLMRSAALRRLVRNGQGPAPVTRHKMPDVLLLLMLALQGSFAFVPERLMFNRLVRGAHLEYEDKVEQLRPGASNEARFGQWAFLGDLLRIVRRADLPVAERTGLSLVVLNYWGRRSRHRLLQELNPFRRSSGETARRRGNASRIGEMEGLR